MHRKHLSEEERDRNCCGSPGCMFRPRYRMDDGRIFCGTHANAAQKEASNG